MTHITQEQATGLSSGKLTLAEVLAIRAHARECEACASMLAASAPLRRMADDVRVQIEADDGHATHDGEVCDACPEPAPIARRRSPLRFLPLAASIAAVTFAIWFFVTRRPAQPPAPIRIETPVVTPTTTTTAREPEALPDEWQALVRETVARRSLPYPAVLGELRPRDARFRGPEDGEERSLSPNGEVIAETRPTFRWKAKPGERSIVILSMPGDRVIESDPLADTRWRPPFALERGREYAWQVEITAGDTKTTFPKAPRPPARFRVLDDDAAAEIADARRRFPDDHLLMVILLARHGLRDEAERELGKYRQSGERELADALLRSLRAWPDSPR